MLRLRLREGLSVVEISGMEIDLFGLVCGGSDLLLIESLVNERNNARDITMRKLWKKLSSAK